jgi:phosphoribosylamine-glycine ligase
MVYNFFKHIHAGTAIQDDQLVVNGGRVFGVTAQGVDIAEAGEQA